MSITVILAIMGGIAVAAAAVKGIPVIYDAIKNAFKFMGNLEQIGDFEQLETNQQDLKDSLHELHETLLRVENENVEIGSIRILATEFNAALARMSEHSIDLTITAFKSNAAHHETPSFVVETSPNAENGIVFVWGNQTWYKLHGIGFTEARNGQFLDCIAPEDRARVNSASAKATAGQMELKVSYTNINQETHEETKVTINSWPLIPYIASPENKLIYIGGIEKH